MSDKRIEELGLSIRTVNTLKRNGIFFLSQMMNLSINEINGFRNMGEKSIAEVMAVKETQTCQVIEKESGESLVIHYAFPEYIGEAIDTVLYRKDYYSDYCGDINIIDLDFSRKTKKALLNEGFFTINKVAKTAYRTLLSFQLLGRREISEILDYLKINAQILMIKDNKCEEKFTWFQENYDYQLTELNMSVTGVIKKNINDALNESIKKQNDVFVQEILKKDNIIIAVQSYLEKVFSNKDYVDINVIKEDLPEIFFKLGIVDEASSILLNNNSIENFRNGYRKKLPTIIDWLDSMDNKARRIMIERLRGGTLETCGKIAGVTKERVRQIINKVLRTRPELREDDYKYWFENYYFLKNDFISIFNESEWTYYYLKMTYKGGIKNIEEITWDKNITTEIHVALMNRLNQDRVVIDGEYVPLKREILCKKLAEEYCSDQEMTFEEFYNFYIEFLKENGIDKNEKLLFPSMRAFEARMSDAKYVLLKYGRRFRFYPIDEFDIENLVEKLQFDRFDNVEISTRKLFYENRDLMQEYNVLDEYELHNLLKKTSDVWQNNKFTQIRLGRMPLLTVGIADRLKQALNLLNQIAPVTMEEYAEFYESEYGMLSQTVIANIAPLISEYYHNGVFEIDQPLLLEDEIIILKRELQGDFYFTEDLKKIFIEKFGEENLKKFNARTIKQLGFKVYANFVIEKRFANANEFFTKILLAKDNVDFRELENGKLIYVQAAVKALDDLRKDYTLLEYEDMKFIKYERLHTVHPKITKEQLKEYAEMAINYDADRYFTIQSLQKKGFNNQLHEIGLEEWFFACLIRNHETVRFIKTGGNIVFRRGKRAITTVDFIRFILKQKLKMNIYDFILYIYEEYGVNLEKEKIVYTIKETDLYYDDIMEKIYLNKDYYYEEV